MFLRLAHIHWRTTQASRMEWSSPALHASLQLHVASLFVQRGRRLYVYRVVNNRRPSGHATFVLWCKENHRDYFSLTSSLEQKLPCQRLANCSARKSSTSRREEWGGRNGGQPDLRDFPPRGRTESRPTKRDVSEKTFLRQVAFSVNAERRRSRGHQSAAGLHGIYPALSVMVATVTCGQRTLLKTRITSCEYCSCR
jgi:hypothetical protein